MLAIDGWTTTLAATNQRDVIRSTQQSFVELDCLWMMRLKENAGAFIATDGSIPQPAARTSMLTGVVLLMVLSQSCPTSFAGLGKVLCAIFDGAKCAQAMKIRLAIFPVITRLENGGKKGASAKTFASRRAPQPHQPQPSQFLIVASRAAWKTTIISVFTPDIAELAGWARSMTR
jgi:hypothetical protein